MRRTCWEEEEAGRKEEQAGATDSGSDEPEVRQGQMIDINVFFRAHCFTLRRNIIVFIQFHSYLSLTATERKYVFI